MIDELDNSQDQPDIEGWAAALGATETCAICGVTIVKPFSFAEAAVQHYELPEGKAEEIFEQIEQAIYGSGVDTGGSGDHTSLCSYHAHQAAKDD